MFGLKLGKLGKVASALAAWTPAQLWPLGATSPGMWVDPPYTASLFSTSAGTTAISAIGTVLDTSNPVGLILDRKGGLALGAELCLNPEFETADDWAINGGGWVISGGALTGNMPPGFVKPIAAGNPTAGKHYQITAVISSRTQGGVTPVLNGQSGATYTGAAGTYRWIVRAGAVTSTVVDGFHISPTGLFIGVVESWSIREIPGIHLSQATSAARPVASSRVNLLTKTEDFADAVWAKGANVSLGPGGVSPSGGTATLVTVNGVGAALYHTLTGLNSAPISCGFAFKFGSVIWVRVTIYDGANGVRAWLNTQTGALGASQTTIGSGANILGMQVISLPGGYARISSAATVPSNTLFLQIDPVTGDGSSILTTGTYYVADAQVNRGTSFTDYQRVTTASDYDADAGPTYLKFDGVDDSLASATFAAGTLTSSMDCLIAVRRDSAAAAVMFGLYQTSGSSPNFGVATAGGGGSSSNGAGTPTVYVDGTQLAGGTAVSDGTLIAAMTPGAWHIMEFRGLDMSAWTALAFGNGFSGYQLNGALGEIQLFASGQDANRDLARAQMAAYFGVTLP
jgi:hypothetical protein